MDAYEGLAFGSSSSDEAEPRNTPSASSLSDASAAMAMPGPPPGVSTGDIWDAALAEIDAVDKAYIEHQQSGAPSALDNPDDPFTAEFHRRVRTVLGLKASTDPSDDRQVRALAQAANYLTLAWQSAASNAAAVAHGAATAPLATLGAAWSEVNDLSRAAETAMDPSVSESERRAAADILMAYAQRRAGTDNPSRQA